MHMIVRHLFWELMPLFLIRWLVQKERILSPEETLIFDEAMPQNTSEQRAKKPIIFAMIGLVGSSRSTAARVIYKTLGAAVIDADTLGVRLRKRNLDPSATTKIGELLAESLVKKGISVVMDSDHINPKKRASLRERAASLGVRFVLIRTHNNFDEVVGRIMEADYFHKPFWKGIKVLWKGAHAPAVAKMHEHWRRTPWHYRFVVNSQYPDGEWLLRKLPFHIYLQLNTGYPEWQEYLGAIIQKLHGETY